GKGLEGDSRSPPPWDHTEMEQPPAKLITGSPDLSPAGVRGAVAKKPGAELCPPAAPAGRVALLRQEAMASREESRVPLGEESPAKALEKSGSQPEPLRAGGSQDMKRVPPRSWSAEVAPAVVGKAGRPGGRRAEVCPGEKRADSSMKMEICPWEEMGGRRWELGRAPGKEGSEGVPQHPREEPDMEKPATKTPELLKRASEKAASEEGRRAEVCPWESGEGERMVRAEICPWDTEGAQPEQEKQEGERRRLAALTVEQPPMALTALPKTSSKEGGAIDSKKAEVCPWEVEDEQLARTEICPWEDPAAPLGKERPSQDTPGTSRKENKPGSKGLK
ncbi:GP179 protein, partial [Halcyon senegalensis]|nr:GP179 protein [Halcyon senegalensis]